MAKSSKKTENVEVSSTSIADMKKALFEKRLKVTMREERNTSELRRMRKEIARALTAVNKNK